MRKEEINEEGKREWRERKHGMRKKGMKRKETWNEERGNEEEVKRLMMERKWRKVKEGLKRKEWDNEMEGKKQWRIKKGNEEKGERKKNKWGSNKGNRSEKSYERAAYPSEVIYHQVTKTSSYNTTLSEVLSLQMVAPVPTNLQLVYFNNIIKHIFITFFALKIGITLH